MCSHCYNVILIISQPILSCSNKVLGTPLSCAAAYGHSDVVKYLLSKDISIDGGYEHCTLQVNGYNFNISLCVWLTIYDCHKEYTTNAGLQKWTYKHSESPAE